MVRQDGTRGRRDFIRGIVTMSGTIFAGYALPDQVFAKLLITPIQGEGPFYPTQKPIDKDADLTFVGKNRTRANGDLLIVQGRVLKPDGNSVSKALVEIWQTNAWGRYQDRRDSSELPWDPNFQGYGQVMTSIDGSYAFRTIKPAGYGEGYFRRPPHIHFRISGKKLDTVSTQMYFAGEPGNSDDRLLNNISNPEKRKRLIVQPQVVQGQKGSLAVFDLVLGDSL